LLYDVREIESDHDEGNKGDDSELNDEDDNEVRMRLGGHFVNGALTLRLPERKRTNCP